MTVHASAHAIIMWLFHHHMSKDNILLAMVALTHQVQHLHQHHVTIWLTHIRGGRPGAILALLVKLGPGQLGASW